MDQPLADLSAHATRRRRLINALDESIAIIPTAPEQIRNRDTYHPYRPDSYFWYLTGFPEPEAVLVLLGKNAQDPAQTLLFCREKDGEKEVWDGFRFGPDVAREAFSFDKAYPIGDLEQQLPALLTNRRALFYPLGATPSWDSRILSVFNQVRADTRSGAQTPKALCDIRNLLDPMRRIKEESEVSLMRKAAAISSAAHQRAIRCCRPGIYEYQLEAELTHEFRRYGADAHAYPPIVAGGKNACTLHYIANNRLLNNGDLVLIDAGCEYHSYASDITRTFPVNGCFSKTQTAVYEIVLAAQQAAIGAITPGVSFITPHEVALRILVQGMIDLGLLQGSVDSSIETEAYKRFYMHRTSHWLGLDVHDVGEYKSNGGWVDLEPGMIITVEPGIYIGAADDIPEEFHNIGIRIEDNVIVTSDGGEVYTQVPKTIVDIEALMRS